MFDKIITFYSTEEDSPIHEGRGLKQGETSTIAISYDTEGDNCLNITKIAGKAVPVLCVYAYLKSLHLTTTERVSAWKVVTNTSQCGASNSYIEFVEPIHHTSHFKIKHGEKLHISMYDKLNEGVENLYLLDFMNIVADKYGDEAEYFKCEWQEERAITSDDIEDDPKYHIPSGGMYQHYFDSKD